MAQVEVVPPPSARVASALWLILVIALVVLVIGAFFVTYLLMADSNPDTDPAVFVTIGTSALTGLLGLFVSPPAGGAAP